MVARKTVVKKKTAPAKKTTSKAPVKESETPEPEGDAEVAPSQRKGIADSIINAIQRGEFDGFLERFDTAVSDRLEVYAAKEAPASEPKKKPERKVSAAPKRAESASVAVVPEVGKTYLVAKTVKNVGGAKVKFIRFAADEKKCVVEVVTPKEGFPKGKQFGMLVARLEVASASSRVAKK